MDDGRAVESMIDDGLRITREIIEAYKPVAIVAAYSGGDDSMVSTHFTMTEIRDAFVFNADTRCGLNPTRQHTPATYDRFGWELEIGRADPTGPPAYMLERVPGGKRKRRVPFDPKAKCPAGRWTDGDTAYEEKVLNFGFPGRGKPQHARMYQTLKEDSFRVMLRRFNASPKEGRPKVLIVSGIRGDESAIRAGYQRPSSVGYFGDVWVNPFYYRTAADFVLYRDEFGLPNNPVKRLCGISGECCCGTFASQTIDERVAYRVADPRFADYLDHLESRVKCNGFPWGWGESPPQWWKDARKGQTFLDFPEGPAFQPMCVGCNSGRR